MGLKGIFPVIPTLFRQDDALDLPAQREVVRFALDAGAHGVVFPGVASEYDFLTLEERAELLELVAAEVGTKVPIIGGASAATARDVIAAGTRATDYGIRHLMIMAPAGLGDNLEAHRALFAEVASALTTVEIILQNAPSPIGAGLSAGAVAKLAAAEPAITYVKEETLPSGPAITAVRAAGIPHLEGVFGGGGARYVLDELNRGALGALPAVELTDLHVALYEAHEAGEFHRARELYRLSLPLLASQAIYRMRLTKHVLNRRGVVNQVRVRAPVPEFDDFTQRDINEMLEDLQAAFP